MRRQYLDAEDINPYSYALTYPYPALARTYPDGGIGNRWDKCIPGCVLSPIIIGHTFHLPSHSLPSNAMEHYRSVVFSWGAKEIDITQNLTAPACFTLSIFRW